MFGIDSLKISFAFNPILLFIVLITFLVFVVFAYRYTVPKISNPIKILLIVLRTSTLGLILLAVFEPTLTISQKNIIQPITLFFVDNSRSILSKDGSNKNEKIITVLKQLSQNNLINNAKIKTFGTKISDLDLDSLNKLNFNEGSTNFSNIFTEISNSKENLSSVVIISDGVITDGSNPYNMAEKIGIPIFTVGVGDTNKLKDAEIKNVAYNEFIYAENPTSISAVIMNEGFGNNNASISLYENDVLVERQTIVLSTQGVQNVQFNYTPKFSGEKKLSLVLSSLAGEYSAANNRKIFYVNVLSNKIRVLILAGSPSLDLSFIKNALLTDNNLSVNSITQIGMNKYLEKNNRERLIDSTDVIILIGFPSKETPNDILRKVIFQISERNIPFLFVFCSNIDFNLLSQLKKELPFTFSSIPNNYIEVQPDIVIDQKKHPLLQSSADPITVWNNLPPVFQSFAEFTPKAESDVIVKSKVNNVPTNRPLILTRRLGSQRSIAILAKDIWRWKLQTALKNQDIFDRFILNSIKWLNSPDDKKRFQIKTSKKLFALGEEVEFTAQIYDDSFNPISDAEVKVNVKNENDMFELNLSSIGNGLYEGVLQANKSGNYSFTGQAKLNNKILGEDNGIFNIGDIDIEMMNARLDYEFLTSLANVSSGGYFTADNINPLFSILDELNKKSSKEKIDTKEFSLWSNEFLLIAIVLLFAIEWFIRKREGML